MSSATTLCILRVQFFVPLPHSLSYSLSIPICPHSLFHWICSIIYHVNHSPAMSIISMTPWCARVKSYQFNRNDYYSQIWCASC